MKFSAYDPGEFYDELFEGYRPAAPGQRPPVAKVRLTC